MEWIRKPAAAQQIEDRVASNGMPYLAFPMLEKTGTVTHGFTTREGGVSQGIYASLNVSFTRGDEEAAVRENYRIISEAFGVEQDHFVFSDQTHTNNVRIVTMEDAGKGLTRSRDYTDTDGLITNVPGLMLSTFYADCVPLFFVDPVHRAIGLSHSGWRGSVRRIGAKTIELMHQTYGSRPEDILTAIGPSICQDCYEISEDVALEFEKEFPNQVPDILRKKGNDKYELDLWEVNRIVFREAGILEEHISITDICTCCNPTRLFSHRASHGKRGNLGAFMSLNEK